MTKEEYLTVIYSYMDTFLKRITDSYREETRENSTQESEERVPVWIFWAQGTEDMPEMVKLCISSVQRNFPEDFCEIHFLTMDDYEEYAKVPDIVIKKLNAGVITMAHFSDVLRSVLLYERGGWWIDATVFVAKAMDREFIQQMQFFTQKFGLLENLPYPHIGKGRWSTYLLYSPKGFRLFKYLADCWTFYLERHDNLWDYYITDYIIAIAYDNLEDVRNLIDAVPRNNLHVGDLMGIYGNQEYDSDWVKTLTDDTQFFKMTYKNELNRTTEEGKETVYGHLLKEYHLL